VITISSRWHLSRDGASDGHELRAEVPVRTVSELNAREHWARRHKRRAQQRQTVGLVVVGMLAGSKPLPCVVVLTRLAPSKGLDGDNLVSSMKAIRDGVADALGVDDADPRVTWQYDQRRSPKGRWSVEIRILTGRQVAA
jgi:crossover junction endodeoxyribonuclease RusA